MWRPHSSPIFEPTALEPVKPTLSTRPSSSACSRPANVAAPSAWTRFSTPPGTPPAWKSLSHRVAERRRVLGRLPDDRVAAQDRRHEVPGGDGDREVARGDDRGDADRRPEREQLLVGHLRRHGLAVQPAALADEEVARVDDLLDLAERLGVGLADLARDELGERLLVGLDQAADLGDHAAAGGRGYLRPRPSGRRARRAHASTNVAASARATSATTSSSWAGLVEVRRPPGASVRASPSITEAIDGAPDAASRRDSQALTCQPRYRARSACIGRRLARV